MSSASNKNKNNAAALIIHVSLVLMLLSLSSFLLHSFDLHSNNIALRRLANKSFNRRIMQMDDEMHRHGIKEELTTKENLPSRCFLSNSGHDLTPLTEDIPLSHDQKVALKNHLQENIRILTQKQTRLNEVSQRKTSYLGDGQRGLYVSAYGGLPLFSSGNRVNASSSKDGWLIGFSEPCDPSHVQVVRSSLSSRNSGSTSGTSGTSTGSGGTSRNVPKLRCTRSKEIIGWLETTASGNVMYVVEEEHVCFLSVDAPWPVECQPENFWGTEGQYRSWGTERGSHELSARPLSY